jgi:hypothetical protein
MLFEKYLSDLGSEWSAGRQRTQELYEAGEIIDLERGLRNVGGHVELLATPIADVVSAGASAADDFLFGGVGKELLGKVGESISETEAAQIVMQAIQDNPRAAENIIALVEVAGLIPGAKVVQGSVRQLAKTTATKFPDRAYSGVPGGMLTSFAQRGAEALPATVKGAFSPKDQAFLRETGIAPRKLRVEGEITEREVARGAVLASNKLTKQTGEEIGQPGSPLMSVLEQSDLYDTVPAANIKEVSKQLFETHNRELFEVPPAVQGRALNHLYKVWDIDPKKTEIEIKRPDGSRKFGLEAVGREGAGPIVLRNLMSDVRLDKYASAILGKGKGTKDLSPEHVKRFIETSVISDREVRKGVLSERVYDATFAGTRFSKTRLPYSTAELSHRKFLEVEKKLKDGDAFESFKPKEQENFKAWKKILADRGEISVNKGKGKDPHWYIGTSHHSTAKELGGVNDFIAINPETGDFWTMISDKHDLMKFGVPGGTDLITAMPTQKGNFFSKRYDSSAGRDYAEEARKARVLAERTGIPWDGKGSAVNYNHRVLNQLAKEGVPVKPEDVATVARRVATVAGGATPVALSKREGLFEGSY